jgi:serine/threonine protein phosphatase 1
LIEKFGFVGDIHGDSARLSTLLKKVGDRRLVFLGDYIDRGKESRDVIDMLLTEPRRAGNPVFLMGNHELGLLAFLAGRLSFLEYAWVGGLTTIRSYVGTVHDDVRSELSAAIPGPHLEFFSSCQIFFETEHFVAAHAGVNPISPESRDVEEVVVGRHSSLFGNRPSFSKLVLCGHYLQTTQKPFVSNDLICLNTGCGTIDGPLTCLLYPEMAFVQA